MYFLKNLFLLAAVCACSNLAFSQCADTANVYSFLHDGHAYEVVKENSTWTAAVACAVENGGYLAEITSQEEQDVIFDELSNNAGINTANTQNQFGTASVWLGGSDAVSEGTWIWDGNNDGTGDEFWVGGPNGGAVGGAFTSWGTSPAEPDNSGGQDHLTIILKPTATNFGKWNDLVSTNSIYYLIEYDNIILSTQDQDLKRKVNVFPNPFEDVVSIVNNNDVAITRVSVYNLTGQEVATLEGAGYTTSENDLSNLAEGVYLLKIRFANGREISERIVK